MMVLNLSIVVVGIHKVEELSRLLLELYGLAREVRLEAFHEAALALLKSSVRFDSAIWGTGVMTPNGLVYHSVHLHNEPDNLAIEYQEVKEQDDAAFQLWGDGANATRRFHAPALFRASTKSGMRAYAARFGHQNSLVTSAHRSNASAAHWIALYRAKADDPYSARDQRIAALIGPHFREALTINCMLHMQRVKGEYNGHCTAIADARGVLYYTEPQFLELIQIEWPCSDAATLPQYLLDVLSSSVPQYRGKAAIIAGTWVKTFIFLKARPRSAVDSLTERERMIALQVKTGNTHKQIARVLGIAPATVRVHIQNIHKKLGVHTNTEIADQLTE